MFKTKRCLKRWALVCRPMFSLSCVTNTLNHPLKCTCVVSLVNYLSCIIQTFQEQIRSMHFVQNVQNPLLLSHLSCSSLREDAQENKAAGHVVNTMVKPKTLFIEEKVQKAVKEPDNQVH